jgi:hypothetical protein
MLCAGTEIRVSTTRFAVREMYTAGKSVRAVIRRTVLAKEYCKKQRFLLLFRVFTRTDNESSENGGGLVTRFVNKTLTMECLGPLEADAGHQTFKVDHCGCIGGRKLSKPGDGAYNRVLVQFKNSTVSRRHFEITQSIYKTAAACVFHLRDLGSAGGTFIRLPYGQSKQLAPGTCLYVSCVR